MAGAWGRTIELRAGPGDLEPGVRPALERLGYRIVSADESRRHPPDLRVLSAGRLARAPRDETPLLVIGEAAAAADPRVAGSVPRPAALARLYGGLQHALETHPRAHPRLATSLSARCVEGDRDWPAAILEISEGGCLLQSNRAPRAVGARITFALPGRGLIETTGEPRGRRNGATGIFFSRIAPGDREAIAAYVSARLVD